MKWGFGVHNIDGVFCLEAEDGLSLSRTVSSLTESPIEEVSEPESGCRREHFSHAIPYPKTENFLHISFWKFLNLQAFVKNEIAWNKCVIENSSNGCGSLVSVVALNRTWQKSHSPGLLTIWVSVIKFLDSSGQESHELLQGRARLLCYFQH